MAGEVTKSRTSNFRGTAREVNIALACTSDAAAGTIPDTTIPLMNGFQLTEVHNLNPAAAYPTTTYRIKITDADGGVLLLTGNRSVTASAKEFTGGHETLGWYPRITGTITVSFRNSADDGAANVGNSKTFTVTLVFIPKEMTS